MLPSDFPYSKYSKATVLEALRAAYKASLWHTATRLLGYKDLTVQTHLPIITALEAQTKRKLICIPRGTFKSSIVSVAFPIWCLMRNPNLRIMLDSELYTNSKNFLREIKAHMYSAKFIELFGEWTTDTWNESEIIIRPRTKILKDPSILAGGIGTTKVGVHVDMIIGDDYNSPQNSATPDARRKVVDHYQYNTSILELDGTYVVVGTRYAEDDLIGWILRNELGIDNHQKLASIKRTEGVLYV